MEVFELLKTELRVTRESALRLIDVGAFMANTVFFLKQICSCSAGPLHFGLLGLLVTLLRGRSHGICA